MLHHPDLEASLALLLQQGYIGDTDTANSFFGAGIATEQISNSNPASPSQPISLEMAAPSQPTSPPDPQQSETASSALQSPSEAVKIDQVRQIMVESIDTYLGILGKPLKQKVQATAPGHQLMLVISQWHLAMCESKRGREVQADLMEKIKDLLGEHQV